MNPDYVVSGLMVAAVAAMFAYMKIALDRNSTTEGKRVEDSQASEERWRQLAERLLTAEERRTEVLVKLTSSVERLRQALQGKQDG